MIGAIIGDIASSTCELHSKGLSAVCAGEQHHR